LTKFAYVRFGNVLGSRGSVTPLVQHQIGRGGPITLTHGEVQRFPMAVPQAVTLVILAGTLASSGETFILDMGNPMLILDLARDLIELSSLRPGLDVKIETVGVRPGEKMTEELVDRDTEQLLPTRLEKISLVQGQPADLPIFESQLALLEEAARLEKADTGLRLLRELNIGYCALVEGGPLPASRSEVREADVSE